MQLKQSYIVLLFLFIISCQPYNKNSEETAVLGTIYNAMPKVIPPPPLKKGDMNTKVSNHHKLLKHRYAVYQEYIKMESTSNVSNVFYKYKSEILFEKVQIDSVLIRLTRSLGKQNRNKHINEKELDKYVNEGLTYLNNRFLSKDEQRKHGINVVISFSRVVFDSEYKKAAVCVGLYYDKLSASQTIYILEKVNNEWKIKFTEAGEVS